MAYSPNTADIINLILQGSANVESIIRANSLDQMAVPAANVAFNSKRITGYGQGILSTDVPDLSQLAGIQLPYVISGCIWTADSSGSSLNCSMTSGVVSIKGIQLTVAAVTSRAFTASNDTYVDFADNGDGTANITYTAVPNLQTSPALANSGTALNTLRNAMIAAGSSAVTSTGICQGGSIVPISPATQASTTVASGSNGVTVATATTLNLASATHFPTGGGYLVWTSATANSGQAVLQYTGVSGSELTGVTCLYATNAAVTFATGDTVVGFWPVAVTDTIGNRIYRVNPYGGSIGANTVLNSLTSTATANGVALFSNGGLSNALFAPFVIPPGAGRNVKISANAPFVGSSATAGTTFGVNAGICGGSAGGLTNQLVAQANPKVAVASDGTFITLSGISNVPLPPGTYYASVTVAQGAAGTFTLGATFLTSFLTVELV